jgi:AraC family transcriptional regulator
MDGVMTEAYGQRLGEAFRIENAPAIVTRALRTADVAVTEIRCDNPLPEMSRPIQREDAFAVTLNADALRPLDLCSSHYSSMI